MAHPQIIRITPARESALAARPVESLSHRLGDVRDALDWPSAGLATHGRRLANRLMRTACLIPSRRSRKVAR